MAWGDLFAGLAFFLILEGLLPFASPSAWRRGLAAMSSLDDNQLRVLGLAVICTGLVLLYFVRN